MPKTFLLPRKGVVFVSLWLSVCLALPAQAQHGGGGGGHGGGGHFGGGHSGGGHSSHANAAGGHAAARHSSWFHIWSRKRNRNQAAVENSADEWGAGTGHFLEGRFPQRVPSTYIQSVPLHPVTPLSNSRLASSSRFQPNDSFGDFRRFHNSGCSFNGFNQVCFFEPAWPLLWFSAGFGWFPFDWGPGDDSSADTTDALGSADIAAAPAPDSEASENVTNNTIGSGQPIRGADLDAHFFLLILKNGAERVVTDYWLSEGYIEYVSRDGSRSHVPVDALDLGETVRNNSARGLSFVLRSTP